MTPETAGPPSLRERLSTAAREISLHLDEGLIPFWRDRALDREHGGYRTNFDGEGRPRGTGEKYLNSQCRLLWWFSALARTDGGNPTEWLDAARHGYEFLHRHFWDEAHGGWFWKVQADGSRSDDGKVVYGQSFAIYALAEYARASGHRGVLELAIRTFELLQIHAADTRHGGYRENLEPDWSPAEGGFAAGDRKSLDTHMHLMEAFTNLLAASGLELHRRKLLEVAGLIGDRMIDPVSGCGRNQFDLAWQPLPAIAIRRTWNAERQGETPAVPVDTTSYGHNTELAWLMRRALEIAGADPALALGPMQRLLEHAVIHGVDAEYGGLYRDGTATGGPLIREKEFWQNAEALVGFLDGYEHGGDERLAEAFLNLWNFAREHFIAPCGEWRILLDRAGTPLNGEVGNEWKVSYHTGRAMLECSHRLRRILENG